MTANFETMTRKELKAYVLAHRDDADAIRSLFNRRSPDETAIWYSTNSHQENDASTNGCANLLKHP